MYRILGSFGGAGLDQAQLAGQLVAVTMVVVAPEVATTAVPQGQRTAVVGRMDQVVEALHTVGRVPGQFADQSQDLAGNAALAAGMAVDQQVPVAVSKLAGVVALAAGMLAAVVERTGLAVESAVPPGLLAPGRPDWLERHSNLRRRLLHFHF